MKRFIVLTVFLAGCWGPLNQSKTDPCWRHMFDTSLAPGAAACGDNRLAADRQACSYGDQWSCIDAIQVQQDQRRRAGELMGIGEYLAVPPQNRYWMGY